MNIEKIILTAIVALALSGCDAKTPQTEGATKLGSAPKQTIDKVVSESTKAIEQGEARTREAIDGGK